MPRKKPSDPPEPEDTKTEDFTTSLKMQLSTEDIAERADRCAQLVAKRDEKVEQDKAAAKHNKSIVESMEAEIRTLSNEVRTKATYKQVECERRFNYITGRVSEVRNDTGEILSDRKLTHAEMQRELPIPE